ncbi:hypothetical protein [Acetobacter thailandicus]|uniref:Uncharacterized protein n=1 Tax=Acetobacter thailandicus TaxID=1502842 RepID=A0ABT3QC07_9PROT|nr:hypothetical protein [Acetobacter thailandicus]MCX2562804.1 hypothetical protein [Acetobacter thailandicus]NHN94869.1 hypothetical protein [Acetobacter thailandicus]
MTAFDPKELKTLSDILALILDEEQGQSASALDAIKARARRNKITGGALKNLFQTITDDPSWRSSFKNTKAQTQDKSEEYLARLGQMRTTLNETSEELTATRNYTHKLHAQLQYAISLRKETEMELAELITRRHYPSRVMIFALFSAGLIVGAATAEILHVLLHTATHVVTDNARYLY